MSRPRLHAFEGEQLTVQQKRDFCREHAWPLS